MTRTAYKCTRALPPREGPFLLSLHQGFPKWVTSDDNFLRDFGERFVPGYKAISAVDLLMNAPFEE